MTDRETDELGTVSAEEALIRSSVKDISSDLAEEASMFAAASESSAPADGVGIVPAKRSSGSRRTVFGIATAAIVAVIFCAAGIVPRRNGSGGNGSADACPDARPDGNACPDSCPDGNASADRNSRADSDRNSDADSHAAADAWTHAGHTRLLQIVFRLARVARGE